MKKRIIISIFVVVILSALIFFWYKNSYKQGNWYLIDSKGKLISEIGYEERVGTLVIDNEYYYLLTRRNRFSPKSKYFREMLFVVSEEGKEIFKGRTGDGGDLQVKDFYFLEFKGNIIFLNSKGEITFTVPDNITIDGNNIYYDLIPFYYNDEDSNDLKYGYLNSKGEIVIEPQFSYGESFSEDGMAIVKDEREKNGYIDLSGNIVLPEMYDYAFNFNDGVALVEKDGRRFYIDSNGNEISDVDGTVFSEGFTLIENEEGKCAFVSINGEQITDYIFSKCSLLFNNGYACVSVDGLYGCINQKGEFVIKPSFDSLGGFSDNGLSAAKQGKRWGFVNVHGEWVIEPQYLDVYGFMDGSALVEISSN